MKRFLTLFIVMAITILTCAVPVLAATPSYNDALVITTAGVYFEGSSVIKGDLLVTDGSIATSGRNPNMVEGTIYKTDSVDVQVASLPVEDYEGVVPTFKPYEYAGSVPGIGDFPGAIGYLDGSINLSVGWSYGQLPNGFTLAEDAFVNKLSVADGVTFNIQVPAGETRIIRARELAIRGNVNIIGDGKVIIYADSLGNVGSNSTAKINYGGDPANLTLVVTTAANYDFRGIAANIVAQGDAYITNIDLTGNFYSESGNVSFENQGIIKGLVYAPESYTYMNGSVVIEGILVTNTFKMSGQSVIRNGASVVIPGEFIVTNDDSGEDTEPVEEPVEEPLDPDQIRVVRYIPADNSFTSGTMKVKLHTPNGYEYEYEVLDENTFVADDRQVPENVKAQAMAIYSHTSYVFDFRKPEVSLYPFGRVDSEAYAYALTIAPYVVPMLNKDGITPQMWLAWGDRAGTVQTVWVVID